MQIIPLQAIPNQQFTVILDDNSWNITIKLVNSAVAVSLIKNNVPLISNLRAVADMRIIPCKYQEAGNFAIITQNQAIPDYTQFGITQQLVYIPQTEIDAARAAISNAFRGVRVTAADFDPIGGLPLRFAPQGYVLAS